MTGMGIFVRHDSRVLLFLLSFLLLTTASEWRGKYGGKYAKTDNTVWADNEIKTSTRVDEQGCCLQSCMIGSFCNESVAEHLPQFKSGYTFAEIKDVQGQLKIDYNSTTYPTPNNCRCANIVYSILTVKNDMEDEEESSDAVFAIDPSTGEIRLQTDIGPAEMYSLVVEARNKLTNMSTEMRLTVARRIQPQDVMNEYSPLMFNGYDHPHHRQKRAITGNDITFTLTKQTNVNITKVGTKVDFQLEIEFPANSAMDMLVELFAPDNDTTVMILCCVDVSIGSLSVPSNPHPHTIQYDSKLGNTVTHPDRAIIDFGTVTNSLGSPQKITILYCAVMIVNSATVNGASYWVSGGAEFDSGGFLWVGQASFTADYDITTAHQPLFSVDAPASLELGSSNSIGVEMQLPYPHSTYNFKIYTPTDAPGTMSVCAMQYLGQGTNFDCGNDFTSISAVLTTDPVGPGNYLGTLDMGLKLNHESRSTNPLTDASNVSLSFVTHLYSNVVGSTASLALALTVDTSTLWVANLSMPIVAKTSLPVNPTIASTSTSLTSGATIGQSFSITYQLTVPAPSTAGAGSRYVLEVLAPFTTEAIFSVCSLEIVSVGLDMPCIKKDDLVPVYSSRATNGGVPDIARLDLGDVSNVGIHNGVGDNVIVIKATLSPIEGKATTSTNYVVYLGTTVDSASIALHNESINVQYAATSIAVTNETAPSMSLTTWDTETEVWYNGIQKIDLSVLTAPNVTYPVMELEFLMPTALYSPYIHICKVKVESKGRNLPCLTPEWSDKIVQYISQFSTEEYDRATLNLQRLCNSGEYTDPNDDNAVFSIYVKIMNQESPTDSMARWVSAGLMYSTTKLWIGQLQFVTRTTAGKPISAPTGTILHYFQQNSTVGDIKIHESAQYSLLLKIPPNEYIDLKILVTSSGEGLDICTVRVFAAGDNLPCIADELTTKTYTYHSDNGRSSALLDVGPVKKFDNDAYSVNNFFDADSVIVEVIVTGTTNGSYTFDLEAFVDTAQNTANSIKYTANAVTVSTGNYVQAYSDVVNVSLSIGEFITNDTVVADIAIGEVKKILLTASIPEGVLYKLDFAIIIPAAYVGKLDILDAAIKSVGANLPCIDIDKATPQFNSAGGVFNDTVIFDVGYTSCNWPLKPGVPSANQVVFEAYVQAMPNGMVAAGETVEVTGSMNVNDGSPIGVTGMTLTVVATDTFTDKVEFPDTITNETLIELDQPSNIVMTSGQNLTIGVLITIPVQSQSRFYFDVQMPIDTTSAGVTIRDMRVIGSQGRNVLFMGPSVTKGLEFTPVYNSTLANGQQDYGLFDLGLITNTGLTHRLKINTTDDDKFKLEVDVQMADCGTSAHGQSYVLSFGNKITNLIFVYDQMVQMSRDGTELPDLIFDSVLSNNNSNIDGIVYHSNISSAEGLNTSIFVYLPSYQIAPTTLLSNSLSSKCSVNAIELDVLEIFCPSFYYSDILTFRFIATVNSTVEMPQGFSATDSTAIGEVGTDFNIRSTNYNTEDWYPYYTCSSHYMEYSVLAGLGTNCLSALGMESGAIQGCQILGSTNSLTSPTLGRLNGASAWRPFVRNGAVSFERYIQIYFGNTAKVKQIAVQQSGVTMATSIWVAHSQDGVAWFGKEEISLGSSPSSNETVLVPGAQEAKYIRLFVGNTSTSERPDVSLRFELYGCTISGTMTPTQICSAAPTQTTNAEFYHRSFLTGNTNEVYVCDRSLRSNYVGACQTSTDGNTWTEIDEGLASVIGMETSLNYIFGFGQNLETVMRSEDSGVTWQAVERAELDQRMLSGSWKNAVNVPESTDATLVQSSPALQYTQAPWGANYYGLYLSGNQRLTWTSTGP